MRRRNESQKAHFEYSFEQVRCLTASRQTIYSQGGHPCRQTSKQQRSIQVSRSSTNDQELKSSRSHDANYSVVGARPGLPSTSAKRLARGLGWFSVGLGLAELLAPRAIANISGVSNKHTGLIRLYGLRELAAGIGIFAQEKPTEAVWSRVAGDALDLVSLGVACTAPEAKRGRITFATANVVAVTVLDVICAMQLSNGNHGFQASASCVVNRPLEEVYNFWRDFQNLPRFMRHLELVEDIGEGRSRWKAKGPAGIDVEWEAVIVADVPGEVITWRSLENSDVDNAGAVRFEQAAGGRGTIVKVNFQYQPLAGVLGRNCRKTVRRGTEPTVRRRSATLQTSFGSW